MAADNVDLDAEDTSVEVSMLEMSDEEFSKLPPTQIGDTHVDDAAPDAGSVGDSDGVAASDSDQHPDITGVPDAATEVLDPKVPADSTVQTETPKINYQEEYEKLTKPFKANGGEIQVQSTEEIVTLMQMGANYHKKMSALKPTMKLVKLLERHDLMDESKLGYLIDLSKKDPAAIQKLVKESGLDPLDIDVAADSNYASKIAPVSDVELQLDSVLEDIQETESYARTLQVVTGDWDMTSRNTVATNPHIIKVINEQIGNGIYDKVMGEVERARRFGKFQGVSDFEAYKQAGDYLASQGLLNSQPAAAVNTNIEADAQKVKDEEKRSAQRKAAGAPPIKKNTAPVTPKSNILSMSDEEFLKLPVTAYTKIK